MRYLIFKFEENRWTPIKHPQHWVLPSTIWAHRRVVQFNLSFINIYTQFRYSKSFGRGHEHRRDKQQSKVKLSEITIDISLFSLCRLLLFLPWRVLDRSHSSFRMHAIAHSLDAYNDRHTHFLPIDRVSIIQLTMRASGFELFVLVGEKLLHFDYSWILTWASISPAANVRINARICVHSTDKIWFVKGCSIFQLNLL